MKKRKRYETARFEVLETNESDAVRCSSEDNGVTPYTLEKNSDLKDVYGFSWLSKLGK